MMTWSPFWAVCRVGLVSHCHCGPTERVAAPPKFPSVIMGCSSYGSQRSEALPTSAQPSVFLGHPASSGDLWVSLQARGSVPERRWDTWLSVSSQGDGHVLPVTPKAPLLFSSNCLFPDAVPQHLAGASFSPCLVGLDWQ